MTAYSDAIDAIETLFARSTPPQIRPEEVSTVIVDVAEALKAEIDAVPGGGGGGGSVATDTIFDAKGDLAVGTGSDTASRLAVGSDGQVLTADSGEATGLKWTTVSGTGDVTAASSFSTDNVLVRSDGTGKGVQATGISVADTTNDMSGVGALACTTIELGHASDTTLARSGSGDLTVEGKTIYRADGTDVALADGGTGASLSDPNADRIMFWDDSAGGVTWLEAGSGLTITGTTISATGGGTGDVTSASTIPDNEIVRGDGGAKGVQGSGVTIDDSKNVTGIAALSATTIELGHASDTTLARSGAGDITIEGNAVYRAGGTDVALADGGTGASLTDPNADRMLFWDDSAGAVTWLETGNGLTITTTSIAVDAASTTVDGIVEIATSAEVRTATDTTRALGVSETWGAAALVSLTDAATVAVDMSTGINFSLTIGGNRTLGNPTNTTVGKTGCIVVTQDVTGSRTLAYSSNWEFAGGTAPVLSTAANTKDILFYWVQSSTSIVITGILKAVA